MKEKPTEENLAVLGQARRYLEDRARAGHKRPVLPTPVFIALLGEIGEDVIDLENSFDTTNQKETEQS